MSPPSLVEPLTRTATGVPTVVTSRRRTRRIAWERATSTPRLQRDLLRRGLPSGPPATWTDFEAGSFSAALMDPGIRSEHVPSLHHHQKHHRCTLALALNAQGRRPSAQSPTTDRPHLRRHLRPRRRLSHGPDGCTARTTSHRASSRPSSQASPRRESSRDLRKDRQCRCTLSNTIYLTNVGAVGSGAVDLTLMRTRSNPTIAVSVGFKEHGAVGHTSHLLDATVLFPHRDDVRRGRAASDAPATGTLTSTTCRC